MTSNAKLLDTHCSFRSTHFSQTTCNANCIHASHIQQHKRFFFISLENNGYHIIPSLPLSSPGNAHQGQLPFHLIETCNPPTIDSSPPPFFLPSSFFLQGGAGHTHSPSLLLLSYCSSLLAFLAGESKTFFLLSLLTDCNQLQPNISLPQPGPGD